MSSETMIRAVRADDFAQWRVLWAGYNAFYGREGQTALPDAVINLTWSRFFDRYEPMHAFVADCAGQLLGLAHILFHRSTIDVESTCYLQDLFTSQHARGRGIGAALIAEVYRYAEQSGTKRVYWHTHETNTTAMRLYGKVAERSGFVVYRKLF